MDRKAPGLTPGQKPTHSRPARMPIGNGKIFFPR